MGRGQLRLNNYEQSHASPNGWSRCPPRAVPAGRTIVSAPRCVGFRHPAAAFRGRRWLLSGSVSVAAACLGLGHGLGTHAREPLPALRQNLLRLLAPGLRGVAGLRHGSSGGAEGRDGRCEVRRPHDRNDLDVGLVAGPRPGHPAQDERPHLGGHSHLRRLGHRRGGQRRRCRGRGNDGRHGCAGARASNCTLRPLLPHGST